MSIKYSGGYSDTSETNEDIIPLIQTNEGRGDDTVFVLKEISFLPSSDCNIKINGGSSIFVPSGTTYTNTIRVESLAIVEAVAYNIAFNY
jgi:hypothetical protein